MSKVNRDFGDEAEMSVHDKDHPTLGPTDASQDVESLPRIVVPVGAYTDPNNPAAAAGSVNMSLNDHPVEHSPDYGEETRLTLGFDPVTTTVGEEGGGKMTSEDREEWDKADWQKAAKSYDLPVSGNKAALRERVEAHEAEANMTDEERYQQQVEDAKTLNAGDWLAEIEAVESGEDLAELRKLYDAAGADFATVNKAFDDADES